MRCCVTGGAGFIGSHLVDRLVADGHEVSVLDDLSTGRLENLARSMASIRWVQGDLRDPKAVRTAVEGAEVVFHQAALAAVARSLERPEEVTAVNVGGTVNVLVAARDAGARRVVFASSSSVYGDTPTLPKHEGMLLSPRSPYAATKAAGESMLAAFQACFGVEGVALRYFNVYGERQSSKSLYAAVVPLFVEALAGRRPVRIFGDGGQTRDFTYVGDVVDALWAAATAPGAASAGPLNIAGGRRISIRDLAALIAEVLGVPLDVVHEPARAGDVRDSLADLDRARRVLGWSPNTSIRQGLVRVAEAARATARS